MAVKLRNCLNCNDLNTCKYLGDLLLTRKQLQIRLCKHWTESLKKPIRKCYKCNDGLMYRYKDTTEGYVIKCDKCGAEAERCDKLLSHIFGGK